MELVVLNMFALDDFLGRPPLRVINGVYDFIGSDAATPPALYSDPDHIKFRAKLTKVHAAHYAKGSATNTVEGAMKRMTAAMVIEAKPPIVDLGCGHGDGFEIFANSPADVIGVDTELDLLVRAKQLHPQATVLRANLHDLPFRAASIHTAVACGVLEHLFKLEASIEDIARCMCRDGKFYALVPTEGGMAFAAARFVTSFRNARLLDMTAKEARHAARIEHCNTIFAVENALHKFYVVDAVRSWPLGRGPVNINLACSYRLRLR
jgi:SAM-dependent methyltransferase